MKTKNFKLFASLFTLAAVLLIATMPAEAQSRKARDEKEVSNTRKKIADKPLRQPAERKMKESDYRAVKVQPEKKATTSDNRNTRTSTSTGRGNRNNEMYERNRETHTGGVVSDHGKDSHGNGNVRTGEERGRTGNDRGDHRPNYGSDNRRPYNHHQYDYSWNRDWERSHWDTPRWREYYKHYHPFWFKDYRYYYHHPKYGHVVKRFDFRPFVFRYRDIPYYYYDGCFFTYRRGIGYIYIDPPVDLFFSELPYGYEKVYLDGLMYFRIGDLFFELFHDGFRLAQYPGKYYSYR